MKSCTLDSAYKRWLQLYDFNFRNNSNVLLELQSFVFYVDKQRRSCFRALIYIEGFEVLNDNILLTVFVNITLSVCHKH